ncbi:unnamed protein product [Rodentolepis nana]|uniref:Origin recognition complex subunit 1 n=1 Tax=Rodentolepis nana TaxID=102285 RepID=A0A0R3T587_RODNA|nr:unnamed protein product [Rodentolepis nana]
MLTRNRGKSKSVVEMLGLTKRSKRRSNLPSSSTNQKNNAAKTITKIARRDTLAKRRKIELSSDKSVTEGTEDTIPCRISSTSHQLNVLPQADCLPASNQENNVTKTTTRIARRNMFIRKRKMELSSDQSVTEGTEDTIPCRISSTSHQLDVLPQADRLPDANNNAYKLTDKATQRMLREINSTGRLFISRGKYKQHIANVGGLKKSNDSEFLLKDPLQAELFAKVDGALSEVNEDLDKKDAFLASQGLLRPNMSSILRIRRQTLAMAKDPRHTKSYLRPNPRRTRYASAATTSRRRTGVDRNARIAAKKLAHAKSQAAASQVFHKYGNDNKTTETRRGRPRKSQAQNSTNPTTMSATVTIQTRHRQFGNISKHIDWKYCYSTTEKIARSTRTETVASRKRRAQTAQAHLDESGIGVNGHNKMGELTETQEERNDLEEPHPKVDLDDSEPERQSDTKRKVTSRSKNPISGIYARSAGRPSQRQLDSKFVRRRGAFATPRLSGASGEPEPPRARNVYRADNPQLSVLERLVLGFVDCRVTVDDKAGLVTVRGVNDKDMKMLLLRIEDAHFTIQNVSVYNENREKKCNVILSPPSSKPSVAPAAESKSMEKSAQSQKQSDSSLENGNQQDVREVEASEDISFSGDEVDWNTDYRRRTTQQHHQRPSHLERFRTPRFNRIRSPRLSHPLNSSTNRQSGGTEEEGGVESTTIHPPLPPFRRHRKFVRKVYTGTSTVPKILNRRPLVNRTQAPTNSVTSGPIPQPQIHSAPSFSNQPVAMHLDVQAAPVSVAENTVPSSMSPVTDNGTCVASTESTNVMNASSAPSPQVSENPESLHSSGELFNPASAMSASQLLRLKRNQDENQHQQGRPPLTTSLTSVAVTSSHSSTSVAMATSIVQVSPSVQQQQPSFPNPQFRSHRKVDPTQGLRVESGGPANHNIDLDDGMDFELSTTSLPPQLPPPQLPVSVTPPTSAHPLQTVTVFTPSTQTITPHPPAFFSPPGFIPSIRSAIVSVVRPLTPVVPSRGATPMISKTTTDGSFLTGRPLITKSVPMRDTSPPSSSTSVSSESRRPVVHKCHSIRRLSPKSSLNPENNGVAPSSAVTARPSANSQLLKSLLQNGAGSTSSLLSPSSTQLQGRSNSVSATSRGLPTVSQAIPSPVGPAHQSRGTWQLGGRAIVVGASVIKPTTSPLNSTSLSTSQPTAAGGIAPQDSNESAQFY